MADDRYLTIAQACELLQVSRRTLERQIETGRLPVLHVGRLVRIRAQDLEAAFGAGPGPGGGGPPRRPTRGK